VLNGVLDLDDSFGDVRRQLAYEETQEDGQGFSRENGDGIFAMMTNLYRGWDDNYHKIPNDSEYVHSSHTALEVFVKIKWHADCGTNWLMVAFDEQVLEALYHCQALLPAHHQASQFAAPCRKTVAEKAAAADGRGGGFCHGCGKC
jgi:hypothetical protein